MRKKSENKVGAPIGNTNAEKWTIEEATQFFNDALMLSGRKVDYVIFGKTVQGYEFDFIGEIARELNSYIDVFDYLVDKFPELSKIKSNIKSNCEANCFSNSKKGIIKEATAIVNLKSNHGWTDRQKVEQLVNLNVDPFKQIRENAGINESDQ